MTMGIMLGNLMPEEIEKRTGIKFTDEFKQLLMSTHNPKADDIKEGHWHCFDLPFCFVCGDKATAYKFLKLFNEYDWREAKECLTMSWERD